MTSPADRIVASLRAHHDQLAAFVARADDAALSAPSAASEWTVADVLSHLGSGAEIMLRPFSAAVAGTDVPEGENQAIWDRWNASAPADQAAGFVEHDEALLAAIEALSSAELAALTVDLGFLPAPVPFEVAGAMRLNEVAQHAWDVQAGLDPAATLDAEAAALLLDSYAGSISFILGFTAKADELIEPVELAIGDYSLVVDDGVRIVGAGTNPTATFTGAPEAVVRLIGGRLRPEHTPEGVEVTGSIGLDDLRRVFPGF